MPNHPRGKRRGSEPEWVYLSLSGVQLIMKMEVFKLSKSGGSQYIKTHDHIDFTAHQTTE